MTMELQQPLTIEPFDNRLKYELDAGLLEAIGSTALR